MARLRGAASLFLLALLAACATPAQRSQTGTSATVTVGIAAINDFHGSLEPPRQPVSAPDGNGGTLALPAGGAAYLAAAVDSVRGQYAHALTVAAGDLIGASQLSSSLFLDEPTIGVLNRIGLDFAAVGNHEFDRGQQELRRIQNGGCQRHTLREPCQLERHRGARFRYLAASTRDRSGRTLFPATALRHFGKGRNRVTVGLIGLTLKDTPQLVPADGIAGLTFADEAETINALVPQLKRKGADAVVVLIHQGGTPGTDGQPTGCPALGGEILPILSRLDPRVDVIVSGHTHQAYVCNHGASDPARPFLLTSAGVYGRLVTDITLDIDPLQGRVVAKRARNVIVQSEAHDSPRGPVAVSPAYPRFTPRADVAAYVGRYSEAAARFSARPVGWLAGPAQRGAGAKAMTGGDLGALIADAHLAATTAAGAQIAFTNPFGIRAALTPAPDGRLTFGDIYRVLPFGNSLITLTMTGAEIKAALEQGLDGQGPDQALSASDGFFWRFDRSRPAGDRVVAMEFKGAPIDPAARYRVTVNAFLAKGGDGFTAFARSPDAVIGPTDLDALEAWLAPLPARTVPAEPREAEVTP